MAKYYFRLQQQGKCYQLIPFGVDGFAEHARHFATEKIEKMDLPHQISGNF